MSKPYQVGDLIYDANIYDGMNTAVNDLEFYKRWLPKNKNAKILELCCGTGRLTIPIAKMAYDIWGVDITPSMLNQAKQKAKEAGLFVNFIEADVRVVELNEQFDFIFIPFNSIHHLYENEDLFQTLQVVKKHLKPDGQFVFDCFNPNLEFLVAGRKEQRKVAEYETTDGRHVIITELMHYERSSQVNRIEWHYTIDGEYDSVQNLDMRMFFPKALDSYLEWHGFKILQKFGNFDEQTFGDQSDKQIFVCCKMENIDD